MNIKDIYHSILTLSFWMLASLGIMQHTKVYFTPEIIQFFDERHNAFDIEKLFVITLYAFLVGMLVASIAVRYISHRRMLCTGLLMSVTGIITTYFFIVLGMKTNITSSIVITGLGFGFLPISSVCAVMKWLTIKIKTSTQQVFHVLMFPKTVVPPLETEIVTSDDPLIDDEDKIEHEDIKRSPHTLVLEQKKQNIACKSQQSLLSPVGIYLIIPIIVGLSILSKHLLGVVLAAVFFLGIMYIILLKSKNFGNFTSKPPAKFVVRTLLHNYMFHILVVLFIVVSCVDVVSIYYLPHLLEQHLKSAEAVQTIPLIMLLLFVVRIAMIIFAELSLVQVPVRRLVLFSHISISLGMIVLVFASQANSKIVLLFAISSSLSVIFPAIVKGIARFMPFTVLPAALVLLSFIGTAVMLFSHLRLFPYLENTYNFATFYIIAACMFIIISLIFFIISYRRSVIRA